MAWILTIMFTLSAPSIVHCSEKKQENKYFQSSSIVLTRDVFGSKSVIIYKNVPAKTAKKTENSN